VRLVVVRCWQLWMVVFLGLLSPVGDFLELPAHEELLLGQLSRSEGCIKGV
jgi:hypothetical protein